MSHVLHIMRKDARRCWIEILITLVALAVFAWRQAHPPTRIDLWNRADNYVGAAIEVLLFLSWSFLVVRVVHGEKRVGDQDFWLTKPIAWPKLLIAKWLLLLLVIHVPLVVSDFYLLNHAGFSAHWLFPRLFMHVELAAFTLLPVFALATLTSGVGQFVLAGIAALAYIIGLAFVGSKYAHSVSPADKPIDALQGWLFLLLCAAVVLMQYSRRATVKSRLLLLGFLVFLPAIVILAPYGLLADRMYAEEASAVSAPRFTIEQAPPREKPKELELSAQRELQLRIPLRISGVAADEIADLEAAKIELRSASGDRWESRWQGFWVIAHPELEHGVLLVDLDQATYDRFSNSQVTMKVTIGFAQLKLMDPRTATVAERPFAIEDVGRCRYQGFIGYLSCTSPVKRPSIAASFEIAQSPCRATDEEVVDHLHAYAWSASDNPDPADFAMSPVIEWTPYFGEVDPVKYQHLSPKLCPGTQVTFTTPVVQSRSRSEAQIQNINLEDYVYSSLSLGSGAGISFGR